MGVVGPVGRARGHTEQEVLQSRASDRLPLTPLLILGGPCLGVHLCEILGDLVRPADVLLPACLQSNSAYLHTTCYHGVSLETGGVIITPGTRFAAFFYYQ